MLTLKSLDEPTFRATFFDLMAFVECGDFFEPSNPQHVAWLEERIHVHYCRGAQVFGAYEADGTPVGFAVLLIEKKLEGADWSGQAAELLDIAVFPRFQGKGWGKELLKYVERVAREAGVYCLYAMTTATSYDVIAFYGRNGLVPVAALPDMHGPGSEGNVVMRKRLFK